MIYREQLATLKKYIDSFPVVAVLGPRQCGKSTLAKEFIKNNADWTYLDLERPSDIQKIADPEYYFNTLGSKRLCIDEVQLRPNLFPVLRSVIDARRENGRFLILGSASPELLQQGSETLAGRISFIELTPFTLNEIQETVSYRDHWLRGGFPPSILSQSEDVSMIWREDFIRTFLERDILSRHFRIQSSQVSRILTMCAHTQGQIFNISKICESIGLSRPTVQSLLDNLVQTFMVRKIEPFTNNVKKRIVKSPKLYIRDSGILHALLGIETFDELFGNPVFGSSWEGYAIENIIAAYPRWKYFFYRTTNGAEMDLVLEKGNKKIAFEFKASVAPKLSQGFWNAVEDINPEITYVVIPEGEQYSVKDNVTVISLNAFSKR
ncbi:MAG: ATP-binding protein [Fibrobacter sp.]|nr:ATP-binding protein [Fibrobacter sp.]